MNPGGVSRRSRVLRGLVATLASLLLTVLGHGRAGGELPDGLTLAVLAVPLAVLLVTLADRRWGPLAIFALLTGSQVTLHVLLQVLGRPHPATMPGMSPGHWAMHHGPRAVVHSSTASMVGAHLLATAVAAAILAGVDRAALVLASAVVDAVVVLARWSRGLVPAVDRAGSGPARPIPRTGRLRGILARRLNARRGPPLPVVG
jgi:hypothetical protein